MADQKLTVSMILNSSSFSKQIQDVNKQIKLSESEFKKLSSGTDSMGKTFESAKDKVQNLTGKLELQNKKISTYKTEIGNTEQKLSKLTDQYAQNGAEIASANKKYEEAVKLYGKNSAEAKELKETVSGLQKEKKSLEDRIVSTNSRLTTLSTELNKTETEFNDLEKEVKEANSQLANFKADQARQSLENLSTSLDNAGNKLQSVGSTIGGVGNTLMLGVAAPLTAIAGSAVAVGVSFESSMAQVQATSSASAEEIALLEEKAKSLAKEIAGASASDVADSFNYLALAGYSVNEMIDAIEPNVKASIAFNEDMATVTDLATDSMSALGLKASDMAYYLDVVAQTSRNANTSGTQLMEAYVECGATMSKMNVPLEESAKILATLADNGLKGSQAGNSIQSVMVNLMGTTSTTADALKALGVSTYDSEGKFRGLETVLGDVLAGAEKMTDEQADMTLAMLGGKTQLTALSNALKATDESYDDLEDAIMNADGALEEMYGTMSNTTKGKIETLKSQLEAVGIQLADIILPVVNEFIGRFSELVEKFAALSPETKEMIVKMCALAVAVAVGTKGLGFFVSGLGGMLKIGGSVAKLFAGSAGVAGAVGSVGSAAGAAAGTAGMGALTTSLGAAIGAAAPFVAAIAGVSVAGYAVYKGLTDEVVPAVDLFATEYKVTKDAVVDSNGKIIESSEVMVTKISDATAEAVGSYMEMNDSAKKALTEIYVTSEDLTEETANLLSEKYTAMADTIKNAYDESYAETLETMTKFYAESSVLTEEQEAEALRKAEEYNNSKKDRVDHYTTLINEIYAKAAEENRNITESEYSRITWLQRKMCELGVEALAEQETESAVILERMKSYNDRITTEMVSENIKKANEQRDKTVQAAEDEYDQRIRAIIEQRDKAKAISAEEAEALIADANLKRDEIVAAAEEMKNDTIKKIEEMGGENFKNVNASTGNILTEWDKLKNWWETWKPKEKVFSIVSKIKEYVSKNNLDVNSDTGVKNRSTVAPASALFGGVQAMSDSIMPLSDSLYVPSARDVATEMRSAGVATNANIGSVESGSSTSSKGVIDALQSQNQLLMQMVTLLSKTNDTNVSVQVDGKVIAKATAKYMNNEINTITQRKNRLGGSF